MPELCPFCKRYVRYDGRRWELRVCRWWGVYHILESRDHDTGQPAHKVISNSCAEAS